MADLFFPQLATGALAQYPLRKTTSMRNPRNVLPDGSLIVSADPDATEIQWHLAYQDLSPDEVSALSTLFNACQGRFRGFTFIDPTDNMLSQSANLLSSPWIASPGLTVTAGAADPVGGTAAFLLTNNGQQAATLSQTLHVPADYQYCLSVYAVSGTPASLTLQRASTSGQDATTTAILPQWTRVISSGALADFSTGITVSFSVAPGEQITLYGPQLEPQLAPSRFVPTLTRSGVYADAHFAVDAFSVVADAPNLYSTVLSIEARITQIQ